MNEKERKRHTGKKKKSGEAQQKDKKKERDTLKGYQVLIAINSTC